ncbi:MAG TPA: amino acid permease [Patescibacteria group bacterium]|nr:amino acid permease [Patescibacteria group bacterium]
MSDASSTPPATGFRRDLGLFDATMIVAGSMIGSGIFIVSADIARLMQTPFWLMAVWVATGLLTVVAALASGELAGMFPHAGGQYVYLREAFGPLVGFLYGWTLFLVIQTGTIAAVAVAFAKFLGVMAPWVSANNRLVPLVIAGHDLSITTQRLVAIVVVALLTWLNTRGIRTAKWTQNLFTATKVGALALLALVPLLGRSHPAAIEANFRGGRFFGDVPLSGALLMTFGAAMVGSLFSSDAWNNIAFAGEEVKDARRNVARSMALGTLLVSLLYCLANVAYLNLIPLQGAAGGADPIARGIQYAAEDRVGTAAVQIVLGASGGLVMALFVIISTFGCENGLILAGPRLYYAMAKDGLFFAGAGRLSAQGVPARGLLLQGFWACLLTLSGTYGNLLDYIIMAALLFYALTVAGLFVLRARRPDVERPYRVPGYPWLPALYITVTTAIMLDLLVVKPDYTWPGLLIVVSGIPVFYLWRRRPRGAGAPRQAA